jgi:hypothetical protein
MATGTITTKKEKTVDLPPKGNRNTDPISGAAGAHPIEAGVGAAVGGAAAGLAIGVAAGPIGAVVGAVAGGLAGGLGGKAIGELIDPTTEDQWLREYHGSQSNLKKGESLERYRDAYRYGISAADRHAGLRFEDVESELKAGWESRSAPSLSWNEARSAVKHAYDRTVQFHGGRKV